MSVSPYRHQRPEIPPNYRRFGLVQSDLSLEAHLATATKQEKMSCIYMPFSGIPRHVQEGRRKGEKGQVAPRRGAAPTIEPCVSYGFLVFHRFIFKTTMPTNDLAAVVRVRNRDPQGVLPSA
jgi:hypothetical protein